MITLHSAKEETGSERWSSLPKVSLVWTQSVRLRSPEVPSDSMIFTNTSYCSSGCVPVTDRTVKVKSRQGSSREGLCARKNGAFGLKQLCPHFYPNLSQAEWWPPADCRLLCSESTHLLCIAQSVYFLTATALIWESQIRRLSFIHSSSKDEASLSAFCPKWTAGNADAWDPASTLKLSSCIQSDCTTSSFQKSEISFDSLINRIVFLIHRGTKSKFELSDCFARHKALLDCSLPGHICVGIFYFYFYVFCSKRVY